MKRKILLLLFVVLLFADSLNFTSALGFQDDAPDQWLQVLSTQRKRFLYFMGFSGAMVFRQEEAEDNDPYIEPIWYFDHPTILAELDADAKTKSTINAAFSDWHDEILVGIQESIKQGNTSEDDQEELKKEELKIFRKFDRRLKSTLSPEQSTRLRQMQLRFLINHNGFFQFLNQEQIGVDLGIEQLPVNEFKPLQREIGKKLIVDSKQVVASAIDDWLADLSGEQREQFDRSWKRVFEQGNALEQLIWQLDYQAYLPEKKATEDPLDVWANWPAFSIDVDGNISVRATEKSKIPNENLETQKLYTVQRLVRTPFFIKELAISDEQRETMEKINSEFLDHKYAVNGQIGIKYGIQGRNIGQPGKERMVYNMADRPGVMEEYLRLLNEDSDDYRKRLMDVLFPHQKEVFGKSVETVVIRGKGPLAELMEGGLCELLELTEAQKKSIEKNASVVRKELMRESRRLHENALQELVGRLSQRDRQKLSRRLGKEPEHGSANLYGFAIALMATDE